MTPPLRVAALALFAVATAFALGCSGGSSGSSVPAPIATATGGLVPVANASRGSLTLALDALKTAGYYAQFLRPGARSTLAWYRLLAAHKRPAAGFAQPLDYGGVPTPNPAPSCDPKSQIAVSSTPDVSKKNYVVVTAFYPEGDSTCSKSPYAVLEMYYPDVPRPFSQGPQLGVGYEATFFKAAISEFDVVNTAIYAAGDGKAQVDTRIDRYDADQSPALVPPSPGPFPQTFPLAFPLPSPPPVGTGQSFVSDFYATVETGIGTSKTGTATLIATNQDFLPYSELGKVQFLAAVDAQDVTVRAQGSGQTFSYGATHRGSLYAFDVQPLGLQNGGAFLGPGATAWTLNPLVSGVVAENFGTTPTDSATYALNGSIRSEAATFKDVVNQVSVALAVRNGGSTFSARDDLRGASATIPAVVRLSPAGSSPQFSFKLDSTRGLVLVNSIAE